MTPRLLVILAALGSAAMLLGAFGFQYLGDLAPCKMCLWQRWPHAAAVIMGVVIILLGWYRLAWLGATAALTTAGIGAYHMGVEQGWWEGPSTCTSGDISGLSTDALLDQIMSAPLVRCDEIAWAFAGISMAGWNMIISAGLAVLWAWAAKNSMNGGNYAT